MKVLKSYNATRYFHQFNFSSWVFRRKYFSKIILYLILGLHCLEESTVEEEVEEKEEGQKNAVGEKKIGVFTSYLGK